jgi:peptidyl-dipeptidase Dcp
MSASTNPLLAPWTTPFGMPPFATLKDEDFRPAFREALARHTAEIAAIGGQQEAPSFTNTIEAMERAGQDLERVASVFFNLSSADTNDERQAIEREMSPVLARHSSAIYLDAALFARVDALKQQPDPGLTPEQARVLDRVHAAFVRAGAKLDEAGRERMRAIVERLATLGTAFSQNVLADEKSYALVLETADDRAGLPDFLLAAAGAAAAERGHKGKHVITLSRSLIEPFLTFSSRRDLREVAFKAWVARGENGGASDNRAIVKEMLALRIERARLLGFPTFAAFKLDDSMAKTPAAVRGLLEQVWAPATARFGQEREDLSALAAREGHNGPIEAWDWRYYAEKLRRERHALDEAAIKPFFQLDRVIAAAFDVAGRLFNVSFHPRPDLTGYHPDVRIWEATTREGRHVGLFVGDYFNRASKRSGAWMSSFRDQHKLGSGQTPIIINVMNFAKPAEGEPALLSVDDARTLFHEFGHGLHGLLSDVTYPWISGTSVARDFVELPSQLYEHWLLTPEVLFRHAIHASTGETMPQALVEAIMATRTFNQGMATVEYTASALVDLAFHELDSTDELDPIAFENAELERLGMPQGAAMRHRTPHFSHIFSGDGYSAGYYSYMWSEVLDADAFDAFSETGDVFHPATAERLKRFIYSAGGSRDPAELYTAFRGRMPTPEAMLKKRGLATTPAA